MRKFNIKNPTEMKILHILAYGEGVIHRDDFIKYSNKTLLSRYKTAGLLKPYPAGEKGLYQITEQFKQAFRQQIDPDHKFSGSHAPDHASGVNRVLSQFPTQAQLKSGCELQWEHRLEQLNAHSPYHARASHLLHLNQQAFYKAQAALDAAQNQSQRAFLLEQREQARQKLAQSANLQNRCSTPDLAVTLTRDQLCDFLQRQREEWEQPRSRFQQELYQRSIQRMEQLVSSAQPVVTLFIEIVTDNYGRDDIQAKENWSYCTENSPIVYIPAKI